MSIDSSATPRRRDLLAGAAALAGAVVAAPAFAAAQADPVAARPALKGRIKHSVCHWCFSKHWDIERMAALAAENGLKSVELVPPATWPVLKKHGLACAIASNGMAGPPFVKGFNNPKYHEQVVATTAKTIDLCADAGVPAVIAFTGYKWRNAEDPKSGDIGLEQGFTDCVAGLKKVAGHAEKKKVVICLEMLNTRDDSHPMKGHPGYQGDHMDWCADIVRKVGSSHVKLLYDIYHVQIMDGDQIRRIRELKGLIGHVHTAGNPGRAELDDKQEISYGPIMRALTEIGYDGYVGHEFIPTGDPLAGLRQAVDVCDV